MLQICEEAHAIIQLEKFSIWNTHCACAKEQEPILSEPFLMAIALAGSETCIWELPQLYTTGISVYEVRFHPSITILPVGGERLAWAGIPRAVSSTGHDDNSCEPQQCKIQATLPLPLHSASGKITCLCILHTHTCTTQTHSLMCNMLNSSTPTPPQWPKRIGTGSPINFVL